MKEIKLSYDFWRSVTEGQKEDYLPFPAEAQAPLFSDSLQKLGMGELSEEREKLVRSLMGLGTDMPVMNESDMDFLNLKLAELLSFARQEKDGGGFSLYGTEDEEGLHDEHPDDQDDYDVLELDGDVHTHHIEVEVNDGPLRRGPIDPNEPSCEFTFEYDRNGKLIQTFNNIEEKLGMLNSMPLAAQNLADANGKKKSKKKKKRKAEASGAGGASSGGSSGHGLDPQCCLFCQYEHYFGQPPTHMMRWHDMKMNKEEKRRQHIKEKLANIKLMAIQRQYERTKEHEHDHDHRDEDSNQDTTESQT